MQHAKKIGVALVLAPTGDCIKSGRFSASYARSYGHYVINHSVSHPNLTKLSYNSVLTQLSSPGVVTNYGRPPYGAYNTTVKNAYAAKGMRIWLWNVDTRDWDGPASQATVVKRAVSGATKGSTVLMHMQRNGFQPHRAVADRVRSRRQGSRRLPPLQRDVADEARELAGLLINVTWHQF